MSIIRKVSSYALVGVVNTIVHWLVFLLIYYVMSINQALSNFVAFLVAVSFSFFLNGRFTFNARLSFKRYLMFTAFMGAISYLVGFLADQVDLPPMATLISFTCISFILGFLWSQLFVFKKKKIC